MPRVSRTAPRVDDSPLARRIGERLRRARLAAGLTQQQLAEGRYTKAYVSALENGISRPSMSALHFFADRLGVVPSQLINDEPAAWARLEADLALASGRWTDASDAYAQLLDAAVPPDQRAELLLGLAESYVRLERGRESIGAAAEAAQLFHQLGREADAALAEYWLSASQYQQDNAPEAKAILRALLARVRAGLRVEPDFELRLVMALSSNESRAGNHSAALAYLEEVRNLADQLDDRRRAAYLYDLAYSYRETGDFEAAVRTGIASLELYRRADAELESARLENDLALSFLALGNDSRADELAASAVRRAERLADEWGLAHAVETQARITLKRGDPVRARELAQRAVEHAEHSNNAKALIDALVTSAHAASAGDDQASALAGFERAATVARGDGSAPVIRATLRVWAEALAAAGEHERAFGVMRDALSV